MTRLFKGHFCATQGKLYLLGSKNKCTEAQLQRDAKLGLFQGEPYYLSAAQSGQIM